MVIILLQIILISTLLFIGRRHGALVIFFTLLQSVSFFLQYLVGSEFLYSSYKTFFNVLFVNLNLLLIFSAWRSNISHIYVKNAELMNILRRVLFFLLKINLLIASIVLFVVLIYLRDISAFKAQKAFAELYGIFPLFGFLFRYLATTQMMGYFAIPVFFYYYNLADLKKARQALILSSSSLLAAFALYSRSSIITYILFFVSYFLLIKGTLSTSFIIRIEVMMKKMLAVIIVLFFALTFVRFSAMDYYADRIPKKSIVKNPIAYSMVDYASQGYKNGINELEKYDKSKKLNGTEDFYAIYQVLSFFNVIQYNTEDAVSTIDDAYGNDGGAFHGYTCNMVFNYGYLLTLLFSLSYYFFIKKKVAGKRYVPIEHLIFSSVFLLLPATAIFYSALGLIIVPVLLLLVCYAAAKYVSNVRKKISI